MENFFFFLDVVVRLLMFNFFLFYYFMFDDIFCRLFSVSVKSSPKRSSAVTWRRKIQFKCQVPVLEYQVFRLLSKSQVEIAAMLRKTLQTKLCENS